MCKINLKNEEIFCQSIGLLNDLLFYKRLARKLTAEQSSCN